MFCDIAWNREFVDSQLPPTWRHTAYTRHRAKVLCEREKSRLPEAQDMYTMVQERKEQDALETEKIRAELQRETDAFNERQRAYWARRDRLYGLLARVDHRAGDGLDQYLQGLSDVMPARVRLDDADAHDTVSTTTHCKYVIGCPRNACNGFINDKYTCGICSVRICASCHVEKTQIQHVCDPGDVASIKQLKKDSKQCPGCSSLIHKVTGCDQMWCTRCQTAFSWKTGKKITGGVVHNPHFFEWARSHENGLLPEPVGAHGCPIGLRSFRTVCAAINRIHGGVSKVDSVLDVIYREINELEDGVRWNDRYAILTHPDPTRGLRIKFLHGDISEDEWRGELQKHDKQSMKIMEFRQVNEMYVSAVKDIMVRVTSAQCMGDLDVCQNELISLGEYVKASIAKINKRYATNMSSGMCTPWLERLKGLNAFCAPPTDSGFCSS